MVFSGCQFSLHRLCFRTVKSKRFTHDSQFLNLIFDFDLRWLLLVIFFRRGNIGLLPWLHLHYFSPSGYMVYVSTSDLFLLSRMLFFFYCDCRCLLIIPRTKLSTSKTTDYLTVMTRNCNVVSYQPAKSSRK